MTDRVVLAYSGGLATSVAIGHLVEKTGDEVVAVAVRELNRRAGEHGVGRPADVEAPGAVALVTAHRALEAVTPDRDTARFKRTAEGRWGELVLSGRWSSPLGDALTAFVDTTQDHVSGEVRPLPHDGRAAVDGHRGDDPPHDSTLDTRDEGDTVELSLDLTSKRDLNK